MLRLAHRNPATHKHSDEMVMFDAGLARVEGVQSDLSSIVEYERRPRRKR